MAISPEDVLAFWFDESGPEKWFEQSDQFDDEIRKRLGAKIQAAREGKLAAWSETQRGCLALIILIDQLSRNIHRGSPLTWSADALGLDLTRLALDKEFDGGMNFEERKFTYMPLMHSERLEDQDLSVTLFKKLADEGAENGDLTVDYAIRHRDIVAEFGRFPHRNEILGRTSTPEEIELLKDPNASF